MRIVFSPLYSGSCYIDLQKRKDKDSLLGLKVCGCKELLSELELRAGLVSQELSEPERLVAFHEALSKNVQGTIFEQSFKTDEVGVARQLMTWCDNLLMEGWIPNTTEGTDKLKSLSKIANGVVGKHEAQRWRELTDYIKEHTIFQKDDVIEIHHKELIPAVIKSAIEQLAKQAIIDDVAIEGEMPSDFKVYLFKTRTDAYRWYLSQPEALEDLAVTVSSDNCILNDMAIAMGKPVVNSRSQKSNPQLLQLFKLGMSLFARPLNVYNLLSYLQVPGNPLGSVSYKLARVLANEGGINEEWQKTIEEHDFKNDDGKDERTEKLTFIEMINKDYESNKIPVEDINDYAGKLATWCNKMTRSKHVSDERKEQFIALASFCRSLVQTLKDKETITSEELLLTVEGIYQPLSFTHFKAEKGAPDFVSDITQLADSANKVCWLGCVGGSLPSYPFDFLNADEIAELNKQEVTIPTKTEYYTQYRQLQLNALRNIRQNLILVCWEYDGNERQEEHPLITELKHQYKEEWGAYVIPDAKPNLKSEKDSISNLEPQFCYQLSNELANLKREKESYTSIDSLIQHPFDYTIEHLLKLRDSQVTQLADLDITKGLVAHRFVETLVKKFGEQMPEEYNKMDQKTKTQLMDDAIQQKGAILLLPEYKIDCLQFKAILNDSVSVLVSIIQNLHLKPVDCEVEFNVNLDTIGAFGGSIDMVLKNANSQLVIFDFKWSEHSSFEKKLKENRAMQLELYRQAAKLHFGTEVAAVAYYLFPKKTLYTTEFPKSEHIRQVNVNSADEERKLFDEIKNSYEYRRNELNQGHIEESELTKLNKIPYVDANNTDNPLYSLEADYNDDELKGCPYVKVYRSPFAKKKIDWKKTKDPKEIKTTHPILKGRLL